MSKDLATEIAEGNPEALALVIRSLGRYPIPEVKSMPGNIGFYDGDLCRVNGDLHVFGGGKWWRHL